MNSAHCVSGITVRVGGWETKFESYGSERPEKANSMLFSGGATVRAEVRVCPIGAEKRLRHSLVCSKRVRSKRVNSNIAACRATIIIECALAGNSMLLLCLGPRVSLGGRTLRWKLHGKSFGLAPLRPGGGGRASTSRLGSGAAAPRGHLPVRHYASPTRSSLIWARTWLSHALALPLSLSC